MNEELKGKENPVPASGAENPQNLGNENPDSTPDYKALLEKQARQIEQQEFVIEKLKKEKKLAETNPSEFSPTIDETVLDSLIEKKLNKQRVDSLIQAKATNAEEAELIKFHYENTIVSSGNPERDIEHAYVLANKGKLIAEAEEAKRALASKENRSSGSGSGQRMEPKEVLKLTPAEERFTKPPYNLTAEEIIKNR